jgi:hypothetical protein
VTVALHTLTNTSGSGALVLVFILFIIFCIIGSRRK